MSGVRDYISFRHDGDEARPVSILIGEGQTGVVAYRSVAEARRLHAQLTSALVQADRIERRNKTLPAPAAPRFSVAAE